MHRHEVRQLTDSAADLLKTREPDQALREWMDRLARFAMAKSDLAEALRQATLRPARRRARAAVNEARGASLLTGQLSA